MNLSSWTLLGIKLGAPQIHAEALTLNVIILGDRVFRKVMKYKWSHGKWGPNLIGLTSLAEEETPEISPFPRNLRGKAMDGHSKKAVFYKQEEMLHQKPTLVP